MSLRPSSQRKFRKMRNKMKIESAENAEEYDELERKLMRELFRSDDTIVGTVRITAGKAKNIQLEIPKKTRPLTDRMKTQIFDALEKDIYKRSVLDLYAGSGSFGLEALSRGATSATMVDASKQAESILEKNIRKTGFLTETIVVKEKAVEFVRKEVGAGAVYEVIFIDPPYKLYRRKDKNEVQILLRDVQSLLPGISQPENNKLFKGVVILKHPRSFEIEKIDLDKLLLFETYTYGMNAISILVIDLKKIEKK